MQTIRHRLYVRTPSVAEAERLMTSLTAGGRFSFQNLIPEPSRSSENRSWNLEHWGSEFDCIRAVIRRPSTPESFTLDFVTDGRFPKEAARMLRNRLGGALVAWLVSYSGECLSPEGIDAIAAAGFPVRDLLAPVWHTLDIESLTFAERLRAPTDKQHS